MVYFTDTSLEYDLEYEVPRIIEGGISEDRTPVLLIEKEELEEHRELLHKKRELLEKAVKEGMEVRVYEEQDITNFLSPENYIENSRKASLEELYDEKP